MNKSVKKIIAREGLVIIGIFAIGVFIIFLAHFFNHIIHKPKPLPGNMQLPDLLFEPFATIETVGFGLLMFGYPLYLLIRFIIWAIRTLREK